GMGFACLYQAAAVMTAKCCRTRLAFSNAIARSGMGLTFLMAPFTQLLLDFYGWQGALLIFGGIMFNLVPSSMLLRPSRAQPPQCSSKKPQDFGVSTAKEDLEEPLGGCFDEATHKETQLHGGKDLPTTEGGIPHGRDALVKAPPLLVENHSPEMATKGKRNSKIFVPREKKGDPQP
ncbi:MOT5 protein, partial [Turnix velox]|nr:MOT5 protein [Turnix velox]